MINTDQQICKVIWLKTPEETKLEISCSLSIQVLFLLVFVVGFFVMIFFPSLVKRKTVKTTAGILKQVQIWDSERRLCIPAICEKMLSQLHLQHFRISASGTDGGRYHQEVLRHSRSSGSFIVASSYFLNVTAGAARKEFTFSVREKSCVAFTTTLSCFSLIPLLSTASKLPVFLPHTFHLDLIKL